MTIEERLLELEKRVTRLEFIHNTYTGNSAKNEILAWLADHNTVRADQLHYEYGGRFSASTYRMAIYRMYKAGLLVKAGFGVYSPNPEMVRFTVNDNSSDPSRAQP